MKILISDEELLGTVDLTKDLLSNDRSLTKTVGSGSTKDAHRGSERSELTRELAGIDAALGMKQKDAAEIHGVTQSQVSAHSNGKNSPAGEINSELAASVNDAKFKIKDKAISRLMTTLDLFDPTGLEDQMQVVTAAQKLSSIVEKMDEKKEDKKQEVQIILYNPRQNEEAKYEVIEA